MNASAASVTPWAPSSAAAIGNYFLKLGWQDRNCPPIDQMKLQKLLFYAYAWYIAYNDRPLFQEEIEAWPWGPVVRSIYYQTKDFGKEPVTTPLTELRFDPNDPLKSSIVAADIVDPNVANFLSKTWEVHRPYSGIQLSNSTHAKGEPWTIVKERYGDLSTKPPIPSDLIAAVYKKKIREQSTASV